MNELAGKTVTVLGWARSGRGAAALARKLGAAVFVSEKRPVSAFPEEEVAEAGLYDHEFGGHTPRALESEILVLSPGIPRTIPPLRGYRGRIWSELELACRVAPCPIVAVTGANGKTTTTTLLGRLLAEGRSEGKTVVAGNIGTAVTTVVETLRPEDVLVLEVSSFQLESIESFRPRVAVWLNLCSNHLDWYPDLAAYGAAKERIFMNMAGGDTAILNIDDDYGRALAERLAAKENPPAVLRLSGAGSPHADRRLDKDFPAGVLDEVKAPENLLGAVAAAEAMGVARERILGTLERFKGLPHRVERLGESAGVAFFNDSKATNIAAVRTALERMTAPVVLIMGGKDKGEDYSSIRDLVRGRCRRVVAYGQAGEKIASALEAEKVDRFDDAVTRAFRIAEQGDALLLSPACSSYDQFRDYEARGERFRELFESLRTREV